MGCDCASCRARGGCVRRRAPWVLGVDSAHLRARRLLSCVSLLTFGIALLVMRARSAASRLETCAAGYERPRGLAEARARAAQQHAGLAIGVRSTSSEAAKSARASSNGVFIISAGVLIVCWIKECTARSRSSRFVLRAAARLLSARERRAAVMDGLAIGRADSCMRACGGREYERGEA